MKTKCVIYARFSPRPDEETSDSNDKQIVICREHCERKGYEVIGEPFCDEAMSGDSKDRKGLWAAVAALKRGYVLVVRWHHRLARDVYLSHVIRRTVRAKGATIEAVEGHNGDEPGDEMVRKILEVFDEYERKVICARTSAGMLRNQRNGR